MKTARFVLKFVALGLTIASATCLIIAFWDRILDLFDTVADKIEEKKCACFGEHEFDDYADCDL